MNEELGTGEGAMLSRLSPTAPADKSAKGRQSMPRKWRWLAGAAIVGVLVLLAIGVWRWRRPRPPQLPALDFAQVDPEVVEAITAARLQVERKPFSGPAWGHLGMVLRAHDFNAEAIGCFAQAERLDARQPRWPYFQGNTLVSTDQAGGIVCLERAVELCGDAPLVPRLRLAEVLLDAGRLEEADRELQEALTQDPDGPRIHFDLGRLALLRGNWRTAVHHLTVCVEDIHARKLTLTLRAQAYRRLAEPKHAEEDERTAQNLPDDQRWPDPFADEILMLQRGLWGRMVIADSLWRAGQLDQAIQLLDDTGEKYPTSFLPWLRLADLWLMKNRADRAEQACHKAVQADPEAAQAWYALGCIQALERPGEAADSFRRAIRLKPDHAQAHFNLAHCLRQLGDPAGAAEEYRTTLRCRPDYESARQALKEVETKIP
jgi:tetratricopeptide (TPR) repeat protein